MYKTVENYMEALNNMVEEVRETRGVAFLETEEEKVRLQTREKALGLLNDIFAEYNWSEEFVISFAVYCNFMILQGLHKSMDFNLSKVFEENKMEPEECQYLEYIYNGIVEQDVACFEQAVDMELFDFDIPNYYIYLLSFLELCLMKDEDFKTDEGKENILELYDDMVNALNEISDDMKECVQPRELSFEDEKIINGKYSILLPGIIISSYTRKLALAATSDLEHLHQLSEKKIEKFLDIYEGFYTVYDADDMNKVNEYLFFADNFIKRTISAQELGDERSYSGNDSESRDGTPIERRYFLHLPATVSESQYRNIALAKQLKLISEKEKLIQKNEKMVEDYSHSVENIMKPALIAKVANCLREDEDNRDLYHKMMYVYFNEVITQNECRLLKMVHNVSVSKGAIRESISKSKVCSGTDGISLERLACKAVNQIALQLVEDTQKARFMFIADKMKQADIDLKMIDNKLWDLAQEYAAVYHLFREKLNFCIYIADELKDINLNEEELGTSFLYTRIVELITNALTYGSYDRNRSFQLHVYLEGSTCSETYIVIEMTNQIGDMEFSANRTGNGLMATEGMLTRINFENPNMEYFTRTGEKEPGVYVTRLYIDADLYM